MVEKKKWIEIELPIIKQKIELLANSQSDLNNRKVVIDLTRNLRGKSVEAIFKIKADEKIININLERMHILGFFIRRLMRKSISYIEDSFSAECKNATIKIKPFLIARRKVHRSVRNALREKAKQEVMSYVKDKKHEEFFPDILSGKFQKSLSVKLKKVYPLSFCDIRDIYIEKEKGSVESKSL